MIGVVGIRRVGWWVLLFVLAAVTAGCGSDGETSAPSSDASASTIVESALGIDDFGVVDTSVFTDALLPEITEDDIEVIEGDAGTSYRYVFPTRELTDGVSFDLEARWDPVDGGLQPSLSWTLTGGETVPPDFTFVVSIPKSFAASVDDIVFDPEPTRIINPDPAGEWSGEWLVDAIVSTEVAITATSKTVVGIDEAADLIGGILARANAIRLHSELSVCAAGTHHMLSLSSCFLAVVADNPGYFTPDACDELGVTVLGLGTASEWDTVFSTACTAVAGRVRNGTPISCDGAWDGTDREGCRELMWVFLSGACNGLDPLDQQICVYEAAAAVGDDGRCESLENLGNPEMANDCRAAITKDPAWCARTEDPDLRASCCENFRGTNNYDTCLSVIEKDVTEESTTTSVDDETSTSDAEEPTTTEPAEEQSPAAIPAGTYGGSFKEELLIYYLGFDSGRPSTNTITITVDDDGSISGGFAVRQEGSFYGCAGAVDDYAFDVEAGQSIEPDLPQIVTLVGTYSGRESTDYDLNCLDSPVAFSEHGSLRIELTRFSDGALIGTLLDPVELPFKLRPAP